jgi:hypothetical protein
VYQGEDNLPAILIRVHCDDFLIHGPTKEKTTEALNTFLDLTVDVGLLCHPGKLVPSSTTIQYCGFL